jgi:hypothetical protein
MTNIDPNILKQAELILGSGSPAWSAITDGVYRAGEIYAIAISGTDDVYVGGWFNSIANVPNTAYIAKWNSSTSTWSALGGGANGQVNTIAVSGTDVYIGGSFTNVLTAEGNPVSANRIAKWDGSAWSALGTGCDAQINTIAISGANIYVGGIFSSAGSVPYTSYIAKWDGSAWSAMGRGAGNTVRDIEPSGSDLYVVGGFTAVKDSAGTDVPYTAYIAKWDGSAWSAVGRGTSGSISTIKISGTDLYIGGDFTNAIDSAGNTVLYTTKLAKWNGTTWSAIGRGANGTVYGIEIIGGDMYVCGTFTNVLDGSGNAVANTAYIARWDGSAWSSLGTGCNYYVMAIKALGSNILVGGMFTLPYAGLLQWNGSAWSSFSVATINSGTYVSIYALAMSGTDLYIGGDFDVVGNTTLIGASNIAKYSYASNTWSALAQGCNNSVYAIAISGTDVYVGGSFTNALDNAGASVAYTSRIAKWNGSTWSALGRGCDTGQVSAITVSGTNVYIGGSFTNTIDSSGTTVAYTTRIAKWNGSTWSILGRGTSGAVNAIAISGSNVYVGGNFSSAISNTGSPIQYTSYIAKWDGSVWSTLGRGAQGAVYSLAASGTDLYVGGLFNAVLTSSGSSVSYTTYVAKWDGSAWSAMGRGCVGTGAAGTQPYSIFVSGTDVYVGGGFTGVKDGAGNTVANTAYIARWDGSAWSSLGTGCNNKAEAITKPSGSFRTGATIGGLMSTVDTTITTPSRFAFYGSTNETVDDTLTVNSDSTKITVTENITVESTGDLTLNVAKVSDLTGAGKTITVKSGGKIGLLTGKITVHSGALYQLLLKN